MKNTKRTMKGLAMLLVICLIAGTVAYIAPAKETQAATAKMTRLDFGRMDAFNNDLVIRYLDKVVVKEDGYEVAFKAGVSVEVEI